MAKLYSYWRSTAAYRVRIALNLKDIAHEIVAVDLVRDGGEQHGQAYRDLNPQGLVPALAVDDLVITQSVPIIEYLEETTPWRPLLPTRPAERARVRAICAAIACDIHPLNNLRVLQYLKRELKVSDDAKQAWYEHWVKQGFDALEAMLARDRATGEYCHGDAPTLADITLVAQMYNARRFNCDVSGYPTLQRIEQTCLALPAFDAARPENQVGAP